MHRTLKRQIKRCKNGDGEIDVDKLVDLVNLSYEEAEGNRRRMEATSRTLEDEGDAIERDGQTRNGQGSGIEPTSQRNS